MREIKFRVWIKSTNSYLDHAVTPYNGVWTEYKRDDLIFQQFTGFKDKEDKEVYEGDIVKVEVESTGVKFQGEVEWVTKTGGWGIKGIGCDTVCDLCDFMADSCTVIGNIYEKIQEG